MNFQVIDSDDYEASGVTTFMFPGGEPHVKIPEIAQDTLLFLKLRSWNDVGYAVMLMDAIYQQQSRSQGNVPRVEAFIPYFPGARQDRSDGYSPLTKAVIAQMFAYGNIPVHVFDQHSEAEDWLEVRNWMPADLDLDALKGKYEGVIAPDHGAEKRAQSMANTLGIPFVGVCSKVREFGTGIITHYDVPDLAVGTRHLVVDDICDGGATFNILAESVPREVYLDLWVSHGIFSRGIGALNTRYEQIFTTDSFRQFGGARTKLFALDSLFTKIMES